LTKRRNIELSGDQIKAFFKAVKNSQKPTRERDNLIFTLIWKYGLKPGEVAGNERQQSKVPGIKVTDIVPKRNTIIVHKGPIADYKVFRLVVDSSDMKRLVEYQGARTEGKLFHDATADSINYFFHQYASQANIRDATPEDLRNFYRQPETERRHYRYLSEIDPDISDTALEMADYFILNFCIENTSRRLISQTLEANHGKDWWDKAKIPDTVREYVRLRQKEERDTTVELRSKDPLAYTTLGHLKEIISDNWAHFESKIRSERAMSQVFNRLNELRAVIAHSSGFSEDEKTRFDLAVKDWRRIQSPSRAG